MTLRLEMHIFINFILILLALYDIFMTNRKVF